MSKLDQLYFGGFWLWNHPAWCLVGCLVIFVIGLLGYLWCKINDNQTWGMTGTTDFGTPIGIIIFVFIVVFALIFAVSFVRRILTNL